MIWKLFGNKIHTCLVEMALFVVELQYFRTGKPNLDVTISPRCPFQILSIFHAIVVFVLLQDALRQCDSSYIFTFRK